MVLIKFLILLTNSSTDMHVGCPEYPFPEKNSPESLKLKNTPSISNISFSQFSTALKHFGAHHQLSFALDSTVGWV